MIPSSEMSKADLLTRYTGHICGYGAHDDERGEEARAHLKAVLVTLPVDSALAHQMMTDFIHKVDPKNEVRFEWDWPRLEGA